jgi:hypothetical protein
MKQWVTGKKDPNELQKEKYQEWIIPNEKLFLWNFNQYASLWIQIHLSKHKKLSMSQSFWFYVNSWKSIDCDLDLLTFWKKQLIAINIKIISNLTITFRLNNGIIRYDLELIRYDFEIPISADFVVRKNDSMNKLNEIKKKPNIQPIKMWKRRKCSDDVWKCQKYWWNQIFDPNQIRKIFMNFLTFFIHPLSQDHHLTKNKHENINLKDISK